MYIPIYYNNEKDEFSDDLFLEDRIKRYIENNFDIIKTISMLNETYLIGGAIRDLIFAKIPKDLDFVVLNDFNMDWIKMVINKYNLEYRMNKLGGLKINYNGKEIDLWTTSNLYDSIQYNVDGLIYDVN